MDTPVNTVIEMLREFWDENINSFEFNASMLLQGNANKARRREIIKQVTGKDLPANKCSYHATINALNVSFSQTTLF